MWKVYQALTVGTAVPVLGMAVGAYVTGNVPLGMALFWASATVLAGAQVIPVIALCRLFKRRAGEYNDRLLAFVPNLERVAGIADATAIRYENDPFPRHVESDYILKLRPLFVDAYHGAVAFGRRFADKELEVAISAPISAEGLRDTSAKFMALARRMQARASS